MGDEPRFEFQLEEYKYVEPKMPPGMKLLRTLEGHTEPVNRITWSPDGKMLASPSYDQTIRLWNPTTGQHLRTLEGHDDTIYAAVWSPDSQTLASAAADQTVRLWNPTTGQHLRTLEGHEKMVYHVVWSPDGQTLASASNDSTIRLWNPTTGQQLRTLADHMSAVISVAWSPDGQTLASASNDNTIRLWNPTTGQSTHTLEGHTNTVYHVAWSPDGQTLASASGDNTIQLWDSVTGQYLHTLEGHTRSVVWVAFSPDGRWLVSQARDSVRIWRCVAWEPVAIFTEMLADGPRSCAFHPTQSNLLAAVGNGRKGESTAVHIWELDVDYLLGQTTDSVGYANARVVLVGDTGVGKSGLALALMNEPFVATESTHGRKIYTLSDTTDELPDGRREQHEILLWDLAGQPGYRVIHQMSLTEVTVALLCFDSRSDTDPFAGVRYWNRALTQAQKVMGESALPVLKYLVATRTDRGSLAVSQENIDRLIADLGIADYFETSAKEGWGVDDLRDAICDDIDWDNLPRVSSTEVFVSIKDFLTAQKEAGLLLMREDVLYNTYLTSAYAPENGRDVRAEFATVIGRVEARGLIRRLAFGNLILLQPELLDAYASSMIFAARESPDGLGVMAEEFARSGQFTMPTAERVDDDATEKLLLLATIEDLLRHEIALRDEGDLIFPSQFRRERADYPNPAGKAAIYQFEGAVQNIYTRLVVRLARSGFFTEPELRRNAVTFQMMHGSGRCGVMLREFDEGEGAFTLFYEEDVNAQTKQNFEGFVNLHLQRHAIPGSITVQHMLFCPECGYDITDAAQVRREMGRDSVLCSRCEIRVMLADDAVPETSAPVRQMNEAANERRDLEAAHYVLAGKIEVEDFDVFLSHNGRDKGQVTQIAERLRERGILPWLDIWELPPGENWQPRLEAELRKCRILAYCIGPHGPGDWQTHELEMFRVINAKAQIIPIFLPTAPPDAEQQISALLKTATWVDFRRSSPDPMQQLIWGITGERVRF